MQHKIILIFCPLPLQSGSVENLQVLLPRDKQSTKRFNYHDNDNDNQEWQGNSAGWASS